MTLHHVTFVTFVLATTSGAQEARDRSAFQLVLVGDKPHQEAADEESVTLVNSDEYVVPFGIAYVEILQVIGGAVEVILPEKLGSLHRRDQVLLLEEGLQAPILPLPTGSIIRLVEDDDTVTVLGIEVQNTLTRVVERLGDRVESLGKDHLARIQEVADQSQQAVDRVSRELKRITEAIYAQHQLIWEYNLVELDFKHIPHLRKLINEQAGLGYQLVQIISGERRPSSYRGTVTAIFKRVASVEARPAEPSEMSPTEEASKTQLKR